MLKGHFLPMDGCWPPGTRRSWRRARSCSGTCPQAGRIVPVPTITEVVVAMDFSPDGRSLAIRTVDRNNDLSTSKAIFWDIAPDTAPSRSERPPVDCWTLAYSAGWQVAGDGGPVRAHYAEGAGDRPRLEYDRRQPFSDHLPRAIARRPDPGCQPPGRHHDLGHGLRGRSLVPSSCLSCFTSLLIGMETGSSG